MKMMKDQITTLVCCTLGLVILGAVASGKKEDLPLNSNAKIFSVTKVKDNLAINITNSAPTQPRGYSFVINKDGVLAGTSYFGSASLSVAEYNKAGLGVL